jgi:hypothetical protein
MPTFTTSETTPSMNNGGTDVGTTSEMFWTECTRVNSLFRLVINVPSLLRSEMDPKGYEINPIITSYYRRFQRE